MKLFENDKFSKMQYREYRNITILQYFSSRN